MILSGTLSGTHAGSRAIAADAAAGGGAAAAAAAAAQCDDDEGAGGRMEAAANQLEAFARAVRSNAYFVVFGFGSLTFIDLYVAVMVAAAAGVIVVLLATGEKCDGCTSRWYLQCLAFVFIFGTY